MMRKHHLLKENPIVFLHNQKTDIGITKGQKKMETAYCFRAMYSFKIFRMIKQIIVISNATIQYGSKVKTRVSPKSRSFTFREKNTGNCVKTLIQWKWEKNHWRKTIQLKIKRICFNQVSINIHNNSRFHNVRRTCWKDDFNCNEKHKWKRFDFAIKIWKLFVCIMKMSLKNVLTNVKI